MLDFLLGRGGTYTGSPNTRLYWTEQLDRRLCLGLEARVRVERWKEDWTHAKRVLACSGISDQFVGIVQLKVRTPCRADPVEAVTELQQIPATSSLY